MESTARQRRKAQTRERVVEAALELFTRNGIVGTKTADIARSIGMSHGVIFLHFPTRDDLVLAVIDEFGRRLSAEFRKALEGERSVRAVLQAHLQVLTEFEPFYSRLIREEALLPLKVSSTLLMLHAAVSNRLHLAMQREHEAGRVRLFDRALMFNTWIGLVHHYLLHRELFTHGESVMAEHAQRLVDHFLALVTTTEESQ